MDDTTKLIEAARLVGYWEGVMEGYTSKVDYEVSDLEFKLDCATATLEQLKSENPGEDAECSQCNGSGGGN